MVRAILFDLYETLVTESATRPPRASSLGPQLGYDGDTFRAEWRARRHAIVLGHWSFSEALVDIGRALGRQPDPALVEQARQTRLRAKAAAFAEIDRAVLRAVMALRDGEIRLAVVSNCFAEDVTAWPRCALAPLVDAAVFSFEIGLAKPDPAIYRETCRRLDVSPDEAVFVGDGNDDELRGATEVGLRAYQSVWFRAEVSSGPGASPALRSPRELSRVVERP